MKECFRLVSGKIRLMLVLCNSKLVQYNQAEQSQFELNINNFIIFLLLTDLWWSAAMAVDSRVLKLHNICIPLTEN